jgi:MFS family permease
MRIVSLAMKVGVLHNRNFRLLWTGGTISALGSGLLVVATPVQVFHLTGSILATGLTLAIGALPAMLVGPWAGVLVDQWSRKTTMIIADVASTAGVAVMLLGTTAHRVGFIYLGLLIENLAVVFGRPAASAILPAVIGTGAELASANSLSAFAGGALRLVSPPLGTVLLSVGGWGIVVGVDIVSYLAAAVLAAAITLTRATGPPTDAFGLREIPRQLHDGLRYLADARMLRGLLVTSWVYWTANAALTALLVPFVVRHLGSPGADIGYLFSGLGVGYLIGSAAGRPLITRRSTRPVLATAYGAVGVGFLALFNAPTLAIATVAAALSGIPGAIVLVLTQHRLQAATPDAILGRVSAVFYASDATAAVAGALVGPALAAATSLGAGLNILSAAVLATALVAAVLLPAPPAPTGWPGRGRP